MTVSIRFEAGERWSYQGKPIRFERHLGSDLLYFMEEATLAPFQVELDDGRWAAPDVKWAAEAHAVGDLKRLREVSGSLARRKAAERDIDPDTARLVDEMAPMRAFILRQFDQMPEVPRSDKTVRLAISKLWGQSPHEVSAFPRKPSPRAVRHWLDERGTPGDRPLIQMVSMSGRVERRRRVAPEVAAQIQRSVLWYWSSHRWTMTNAYDHLRAALIETNAARADASELPQLEPPSSRPFGARYIARNALRLSVRSTAYELPTRASSRAARGFQRRAFSRLEPWITPSWMEWPQSTPRRCFQWGGHG